MLEDITQALLNVVERKANKPRPRTILDTTHYQDMQNNPITIISIEEQDTDPTWKCLSLLCRI